MKNTCKKGPKEKLPSAVKKEIQFTSGSISLEEHILIMKLALRARFFTLYPSEPHLHQK